jgi:hypothetical protein
MGLEVCGENTASKAANQHNEKMKKGKNLRTGQGEKEVGDGRKPECFVFNFFPSLV